MMYLLLLTILLFFFDTGLAEKRRVAAVKREPSVYIVGDKAYEIIEKMPDFRRIFTDATASGKRIWGTYRGIPVIRIEDRGLLAEDALLGLYKGKNTNSVGVQI